MRETITMTTREQQRAWVLMKVPAGELLIGETAELLGLSERSVWRPKRRFREEGPAGLVHGNCGMTSARRIDEPTRERVRSLVQVGLLRRLRSRLPDDPERATDARLVGLTVSGVAGGLQGIG